MAVLNRGEGFAYDLSVAKKLEHPFSNDVLLRGGLTSVVLIMLWLVSGQATLLGVLLTYWVALIAHGSNVRRLPVVVGRLPALTVQAGALAVGSTWNAGLVFLWMQDDMALRLVALAGMFLSMLNALMLRYDDPLLARIDLVNVAVGVTALPLVSWLVLDARIEALSLFITGSTVFAFFLYGLFEVRRMRAALAQAQSHKAERIRIEALSRLTGGVAHDFNNLLTVIGGNLELIKETDDLRQKDELARQAAYATAKAAHVTSQLLAFVGRASLAPQLVSVADHVNAVVVQLENRDTHGVDVTVAIDPNLPDLLLDPSQFETVLGNICQNALDAMPDGGKLSISAQPIASQERKGGRVLRDALVGIEISDTGVGIAPAVVDRVCDPYFSTRARGKSGGLGLAMAKGFAGQSGGHLSIESTLGKGTVVTLVLPVPPPGA